MSGLLPYGHVGTPYRAVLRIVGGKPPYSLSSNGTLTRNGIAVSLKGPQIRFAGTPAKAGAWWWAAVVLDPREHEESRVVLRIQEMFDQSRTTTWVINPGPIFESSVVPPQLTRHSGVYIYGPQHCCWLNAEVAPGHLGSGSPHGDVVFLVDGHVEGEAQVPSSAIQPGGDVVEAHSSSTIPVGVYRLSAVFKAVPVPWSVTGVKGITENPYTKSSGAIRLTVKKSPTLTLLGAPATVGQRLDFPVTVEGAASTPVDPGTSVELLMDGATVATTKLATPNPQLHVDAPPGRHRFQAKYLGDKNEGPSVSQAVVVTVKG